MIEQYRSRILVVDDDPVNVQLIEAQLANEYDIITALSGEEALEAVCHKKPDLIILDVMMPGINGFETCRRIKSSKETCFIPVIIVTALSSRDDRLEGIESGADDFLTKPIDRVELITRANNLLKSKRLHDRLVAESERTKKYFEVAGSMMVVLDANGTVVLANAKCCEVLGYAENELLGSNWFDMVILPAGREKLLDAFSSILKGDLNSAEYLENHILTKNGTKKLISWQNSYMRDSSGKITTVLSSGLDITEQRDAERKIQSSEEKFRTLFENSVDAIMILNTEGDILEVNNAACNMFGYDREEFLAISKNKLVAPEYWQRCVENTVSLMEKGQGRFEALYVRKNGSRIPIEVSVKIIDYNGVPAILSNGRDISERKKAEESISKYTEDLSEANLALKSLDRMKNEFISNLSHELKTPLISIKGYSELVHDEVLGPLNEKQKNAMQIVLDKYDHLSFLLDSLIYMSIVKSGNVNYRFDPIRIEESLKRIAEYFSFKAEEKQIILTTSFEKDLPLVKGDVEYLPYLFRSLVDNAIKFSSQGATVEIVAFRDNDHVHALIKDSGIGIPKNEFSNIFKRFYQIDGSMARKYGGSGLGLYVSKMITDVHDGEIWIESEEGSGTTVHVRFPIYSPSSSSGI
ncbi:PAS domain S-box protein [Methanolobus sp. ZRKC2]|uniref:PAS domain S-box protein n=1 Tax=Methanolobus sp. ZRKC2 TaxID=3125783 RepID=UPI00324A6CCC